MTVLKTKDEDSSCTELKTKLVMYFKNNSEMRNYYLEENEPEHCNISNSDGVYFKKSSEG